MARKKATPSPRAGFVADVLAHPEDDTPRLIFADWLEEHGETESDRARAEFIRLQCRRAHLEEFSHERLDLALREQELLRAHQDTWKLELPKWARNNYCTFRRGFVAVIWTNAEAFTHGAYQLFQVTPLEGAMLDDPGNAEVILECELLERLRELGLTSYLRPADYALLADTPRLGNLRRLLLWWSWSTSLGPLLALADSPHLAQLTELELECDLGREGAQDLWVSPQLPLLTRLRADHFSVEDARAFGAHPEPGRLRELVLFHTRLGDEDWSALTHSVLLQTVRRLGVLSFSLSERGVEVLMGASVPHLTVLDLSFNDLPSAVAEILAGSPNSRSLHTLHLNHNRIGPEGAEALARSPHLSRLRHLSLVGNPIGEKGINALKERFGPNAVVS